MIISFIQAFFFLIFLLWKFLFQVKSLPTHISQHDPRTFLVLEREREREIRKNRHFKRKTDVIGHVNIPMVRHGVFVPRPLVDPKAVRHVLLVPHSEKVGPTWWLQCQKFAIVEHRGQCRLEPRHGLRVHRFGLLARLLLSLLWMHFIASFSMFHLRTLSSKRSNQRSDVAVHNWIAGVELTMLSMLVGVNYGYGYVVEFWRWESEVDEHVVSHVVARECCGVSKWWFEHFLLLVS